MKKTLTANISGTVFHVEEDAYEKLLRYLDSIRLQFTGNTQEEIMQAIRDYQAGKFTAVPTGEVA